MRKLIALVIISALLYGGYWFVGRSQVEDRLVEALAVVNDGPYSVTYDSLNTRGFPSRFDTTVTNLEFTDQATGAIWTAPIFQLFALAYRPNEVIAVFPPEQDLTIAGETYTLLTEDMRASGTVRPNASLAFQNATITMDSPLITSPNGFDFSLGSVLAAMRLSPETTQTYEAFLEARDIVLSDDLRRFLDPTNLQPPVIQSLRFESDVDMTAPIELNSAAGTLPDIASLSIKEFAVVWGEMSATIIGEMEPDVVGRMDGSLTVSARNWQDAVDLAVANGILDGNRRFLISEVANSLDETPHIPDTLTLTLDVKGGLLTLGGFPLGSINPF